MDAGSFSTPDDAYPWPDFEPSPESPAAGEETIFHDNSLCYNGTNEVDCESMPGSSYEWDFDDDGTVDSTKKGTVSHTYDSPGDYTVRLTITDAHGHTCDTTRTLEVTAPLPEWEETKPWE